MFEFWEFLSAIVTIQFSQVLQTSKLLQNQKEKKSEHTVTAVQA